MYLFLIYLELSSFEGLKSVLQNFLQGHDLSIYSITTTKFAI